MLPQSQSAAVHEKVGMAVLLRFPEATPPERDVMGVSLLFHRVDTPKKVPQEE